MDVRAHNNAHHFCRWCHQTFPQIQIFLQDSLRKEISKVEHQIALKNGALELFPAMNRHNLVLNSTEVLQNINTLLAALESQFMSKDLLLTALKRVDEKMGYGDSGVSAPPLQNDDVNASATIVRNLTQELSAALAEVRSLNEVSP
jgi:hypothetical protein